MKKVLIIQESLRGGGAEKVLINILKNIDYTKYCVDLILLIEDGVYINDIPKEVTIRRIYPKFKFKKNILIKFNNAIRRKYIKYFTKTLYNILIGNRYDIEIAFLEGITTNLLSKSSNDKSKKIAWVHTDLKKFRVMDYKVEKKCYEKMDNIVCVSNDAKFKLQSLYPHLKRKITVIYNLIDKEDILEKSKINIDYSFGKNTIISVGRLVDSKGFDKLIMAHKKLLEEGTENNLIIIGSGGRRKKLIELIDYLQVNNTVKIIDFQENPYNYIKNADVFVLASEFEGFSLVIAESLILGKAIISTNCVGPVELLGNGEYGIIIENNDVELLKEAIKTIINNNYIKNSLEIKAKERSSIFDKEQIIKEIENIL